MRIGAGLTANKLRISGVRLDVWQVRRRGKLLLEFTDHKKKLFVRGHFITLKEILAIAELMKGIIMQESEGNPQSAEAKKK